ncbi:MAG: hypothetical protein WAT35_13575, partial [Tabrizicola sp.]|uniref:hypothetical protein n=1 Tax=Tabrizicola sp. TaxID=2005166 RepID=UPI003BAE2A1B
GGQRPPFDIRALGRASLHLSREGVAPIHAWAARTARRAAVNVKNGAGRIPAEKLGRAERFVPSHLRVAAWIKNLAATFSHASATADPDSKRGNALVAEIGPHLWDEAARLPAAPPEPAPLPGEAAPVVLPEPQVLQPGDDPLASIRDEIGTGPDAQGFAGPKAPVGPPTPPGPVAEGAIQVTGYLLGWASALIALPYGLLRALWLWAAGRDLRTIGAED